MTSCNSITVETFAKRHFLSDFCVCDERDLRFASAGLNFGTLVKLQRYPRNIIYIPVVDPPEAYRLPNFGTLVKLQRYPRNIIYIPVVDPPEAYRLPPLKVRDLRLELE